MAIEVTKRNGVVVTFELYQVLEPFIFVTRIFGFLPISCKKTQNCYIFTWSLWYNIWSYVFGTFMMLMSINGLHEDFHQSNSIRMSNSTVKYVTLVDLGEVVITVFIGILVTPFKLKYLWRLLNCFYKIDKVLPQKGIKKERRFIALSILIFIICILYVLIYELYLWGEISEKSGLFWVFMKRYFLLFSTYFLVFVQEMPYWKFARMIRKRFEALNEALESGLVVFKNFPKLWISPIKKKNKSFGVLGYERVVNLMRIYELIGDAVDATNDFCGVSILLIMFSILLHLVVTPYFLLVEVANNGYFVFIFLQFSWTMLHTGRLMVIVETCQYCLDEHQKTVDLVFKLLSCELEEDVKEQVKLFALQLSGKKVRFSSFSMMKINRSLLTAIGGSITTFLVILFQFGSVGSDVYYSRD